MNVGLGPNYLVSQFTLRHTQKERGNMPPTVRLVCGEDNYEEVFISLERTPVVLADVRRNCPQLKKELRKRWPVENVQIQNRIPFRRNPYDRSQIVEAAAVGLLVYFIVPGLKAVSSRVGEAIGDEIAKHVRR